MASNQAQTPTTKDRPPKPKPINAIESSIRSWLEYLPPSLKQCIKSPIAELVAGTPRRWVVYPPMVLLPSGSFSQQWWTDTGLEVEGVNTNYKEDLWRRILDGISKREGKGALTHLAVNAGIPLHVETGQDQENIIRTPSGLIMLYGDFGPSLPPEHHPNEEDFQQAFWVSTKQNGIVQIWAPRYTMFSRGNIKEKARLLDFHDQSKNEFGSRKREKEELSRHIAVDMYAGIGYFVFSYVKMGLKKVIGWELNPWSVEGLRRGAMANSWSVKIIPGATEDAEISSITGDEQIVVFLEDNNMVERRLKSVDFRDMILHVNCGLLPNSDASWRTALWMIKERGWLHLHENIGVNDVEQRKLNIQELFQQWMREDSDDRNSTVEYVEYVKTFAPGVWHCVLDLYISRMA
ncbi:tRNA wybutosine-synthesizing protein-like protein [Xylogone sp. PMI_703]|nr:tRNA wybutosine-synthesizing protein-like protein [Xylogone sp. PMI_703]